MTYVVSSCLFVYFAVFYYWASGQKASDDWRLPLYGTLLHWDHGVCPLPGTVFTDALPNCRCPRLVLNSLYVSVVLQWKDSNKKGGFCTKKVVTLQDIYLIYLTLTDKASYLAYGKRFNTFFAGKEDCGFCPPLGLLWLKSQWNGDLLMCRMKRSND